ncbi:MAG: TlpA family protein disulfide reductase, partial [Pedobacter sp.]
MKKLLALILVVFALNSYSQVATSSSIKLDENTVVKDTDGTVMPYAIWQKLMLTGDFQLKRSAGKTEFVVYKMTEQEKAIVEERRKSLNATLPKPRPTTSFKDGEKFSGYKLTDIEGNKYDIKDVKGKIVVLNFWFINCPPCKQEIPELNKLQAKFKDSANVLFLGIALDEKYDLKEFLKTTPFNYNIVD